MYADYDYYVVQYRLNSPTALTEDVFWYWEKQACWEIDKRTYSRLCNNLELVTDNVKDCVCELAELLYRTDKVAQQTLQQGGAGPLVSYSNDGQSGTFDLSRSVYTEEGKARKVKDIVYKYLTDTGLLYAGVKH